MTDRESQVTFAGDFSAEERKYLATHFSCCRFELIRRFDGDDGAAVVAWSASAELHQGARQGPGPLRGLPANAVYVLRGGHHPTLTRVGSREELAREFGDPLEGVALTGLGGENPLWESAKKALRGVIPWR